jgi:hypothetical protein
MTLKTLAEGELSKHIPKEKCELSARGSTPGRASKAAIRLC